MNNTDEFFSKIPVEAVEKVVAEGNFVLPKGFNLTKETTATQLIQACRGPDSTLSGEAKRQNRRTIEKVLQANEINLASEANRRTRYRLTKNLDRTGKTSSEMEFRMGETHYDQAIKMLSKYIAQCTENNQRDYDAEVTLGSFYLDKGDYNTALSHLTALEDLEDNTCIKKRDLLLYYVAETYKHLDKWHEAKHYFNRVLTISNDKEIIAYCYLGLIYGCLREFKNTSGKKSIEEAERYVAEIERSYPKHIVKACNYLGKIYREQGHNLSIIVDRNKEEQNKRQQKYIDLFEKAIKIEEISPRDKSNALYKLGVPFNKLDHDEYSITNLKNALSIMGGEDIYGGEITRQLADAYIATKQYEKAEECYEKMLKNTTGERDDFLVFELGATKFYLQKYAECIKIFNELPEFFKKNFVNRYYDDACYALAQQQQSSPTENDQTHQ